MSPRVRWDGDGGDTVVLDRLRDGAAELFLSGTGVRDFQDAAAGYEANDWGQLIRGAGIGAASVASLGGLAALRGGGRAALRHQLGSTDELGQAAGRALSQQGGGLPPAGGSRPGLVDTPLGAFPEELRAVDGMPGIRDALPSGEGVVQAQRQRIIDQRAAMMAENPLVNPEFSDALANSLVRDSGDLIDDMMRAYAPMGKPGRQDLLQGDWFRVSDDGIEQMVRGGRPQGNLQAPMSEGGMGLSPSPYRQPERALSDIAATWMKASGNEKAAAKRAFAREWSRTTQNQLSALDSSMYDGPRFYLDRAEQIARASDEVRVAGQAAFGPEVVAAASAASSASAPPILEPVRLMIGLPFVRWKGGRAVFGAAEKQAFAAAHPGLAKGNFVESGIEAFVQTVNNPDFVTAGTVRGLAHKTHPYAVLGVDPLNPHAFVADRNYWYLANGHKLKKDTGLTQLGRGGRPKKVQAGQQVSDPMPTGRQGSFQTTASARAATQALDLANPATFQETVWFGPRVMTQWNIEDSFKLVPGSSDTTLRNALGNEVADALARAADGSVDWSTLMAEALQRAGSHWGAGNVTALRSGAAASRARFVDEVASGAKRGWELVDGRPVPNRSDWRLTLPSRDRLTGPANKVLTGAVKGGSVRGIEQLRAEVMKEAPAIANLDRVMSEVVPAMAEFLTKLTSTDRLRAYSMAGGLLAAGASLFEVASRLEDEFSGLDRGEPEDADVSRMMAAWDDVATGWV